MSEKEKYKHFRNFMTNELGITKNDIEAWTKEAVSDRVTKLVGQMDLEGMTATAIKKAISGFGYSGLNDSLQKAIAKRITEEVAGRIKIMVVSQDEGRKP